MPALCLSGEFQRGARLCRLDTQIEIVSSNSSVKSPVVHGHAPLQSPGCGGGEGRCEGVICMRAARAEKTGIEKIVRRCVRAFSAPPRFARYAGDSPSPRVLPAGGRECADVRGLEVHCQVPAEDRAQASQVQQEGLRQEVPQLVQQVRCAWPGRCPSPRDQKRMRLHDLPQRCDRNLNECLRQKVV